MAKIILIDGSSFIHRAFHAFSKYGLTNKQGDSSGAIYGVRNMMLGILSTKPEYAVFVVDPRGRNFRHAIYPEYKSSREGNPEIHKQIQPIIDMVKLMGMPVLRIKRYEADDVIGTIAVREAEAGHDVVVYTGDKDFCQLVNKQISLYDSMKKETTTRKDVIRKYGIKPSQFIDFLALQGDSSDDIPGVVGCGPGTATKLLVEYGTLKAVLKADTKDKNVNKVVKDMKNAILSKALATICLTVPDVPKKRSFKLEPIDQSGLKSFLAKWGINSKTAEKTKRTGNSYKPKTNLWKRP